MSQLVETTTDAFGEYTTRWACEPPAERVPFRVVSETWNDSFTERTIWGYNLVQGETPGADE